MAGEPSFFSIGVADAGRGRVFYGELFGWQMEPTGGGFAVATPGTPGGIHGGDPEASPYLFFRVDDIAAALERVRELGGTIEETDHGDDDPETIARFGRFKLCRDDQGSSFGLHQPPA
jgi:predicted enzyme related to lactoylglutathione lyase